MDTFVELLVELTSVAAEDGPDKLDVIADLFADPRAPAEFQVGRHLVARLLAPEVDRQLDSLDPAQRRIAIRCARLVLPRDSAFRALRRVYFDPDPAVRGMARRASYALRRAIPSTEIRRRAPDDRRPDEFHTLWAFGIFASERQRKRAPRQPGRPPIVDQLGLPRLASAADVAALVGVDELAPLMRPGTGP